MYSCVFAYDYDVLWLETPVISQLQDIDVFRLKVVFCKQYQTSFRGHLHDVQGILSMKEKNQYVPLRLLRFMVRTSFSTKEKQKPNQNQTHLVYAQFFPSVVVDDCLEFWLVHISSSCDWLE